MVIVKYLKAFSGLDFVVTRLRHLVAIGSALVIAGFQHFKDLG